MVKSAVGVKVKYTIRPDEDDEDGKPLDFTEESSSWGAEEEWRVGLPPGQEPEKPEAGSVAYSGMHDQGPLPPPKEGGIMSRLMGSVTKAKQYNDQILTKYITSKSPATKRAKSD